MSDLIRRASPQAWPDLDLELRSVGGDGLTFTGYAAVFDHPSADLGGFREVIRPGAFTRSLASPQRDIRLFHNHNTDVVLASRQAGTLRLTEDARGLLVDARLPDSEWGRPVAEAIRRGDISGMSFGFTVAKDAISWDPAHTVRTLSTVDLHEVSTVSGWPAYDATTATVRAVDAMAGAFWPPTSDQIAEALAAAISEGALDANQRHILRRVLKRSQDVVDASRRARVN